MSSAATPVKKAFPWHWVIFAGLAVVVLANAHLVYVATASQPDCVPHQKAIDASGQQYRSAKSSC